jgi:hypothetical protein
LLAATGCNVLNTNDQENVAGRGSKAFDPYTSDSGARRLVLQAFHGCAVTGTGEPVASGASIPYPTMCPDMRQPGYPLVPATGVLSLVTNSKYFLNQITLMDSVVNVYATPDATNAAFNDLNAPAEWMRNQSEFSGLDWSGLSVGLDRWAGTPTAGVWNREISFTNAAWMNDTQDSFHVEVLDSSGTVRAEQTYAGTDLLAQNDTSGHTNVGLHIQGLAAPKYPGDPVVENEAVNPPVFLTSVKIERFGSTNPFTLLTIPDIAGAGAIRLTWSQLPDRPFYFPVSFVAPEDIPATCFTQDGSPAQCSAGIQTQVSFTRPANGKYYEPGETFDFDLKLEDGSGNLLAQPGWLPSFNDFLADRSNGLIYWTPWKQQDYLENDQEPVFRIIGPVDQAGRHQDITSPAPFTLVPAQHGAEQDIGLIVPPFAGTDQGVGVADVRWSTRQGVTLPADAKPGTYALLVKVNREFMGERIAKGSASYFQVGQEEKTRWPGRVGNCQICHRSVLSLENLRHGFSVNEIEGCKACHQNLAGNLGPDIHRIHMNSPKFPRSKNDCSTCHLTKDSAIHPSFDVCSSCHPAPHGSQFFAVQFRQYGAANRFTECATACHVNTPPTAHIYPAN